MIIGNGLIATIFSEYRDNTAVLIFASGVSNSNETNISEFQREKELIKDSLNRFPDSKFVYFSTYSILDESLKERPYSIHKLKMENLIKSHSKDYLICRLTNIVGKGGNKNTVFNFLANSIKNNLEITAWSNATRNFLDIEDLKYIVNELITSNKNNQLVNIANPNNYKVSDIVKKMESFYRNEMVGEWVEKGVDTKIEISKINSIIGDIDRDFSINYIDYLLERYG